MEIVSIVKITDIAYIHYLSMPFYEIILKMYCFYNVKFIHKVFI
jgi:hypothetical protein